MAEEMKVCPFCGEEILAVAKKCKHCGEFLDGEKPNTESSNSPIDNANVNEKWKERFRLIERIAVDGCWWKYKQEYSQDSLANKWVLSTKVYFSDFLSFLATFCFGFFCYFFKGMWLKGIVYTAALFVVGAICEQSGAKYPYYLNMIFCLWYPYDYYRLKVLGKQW